MNWRPIGDANEPYPAWLRALSGKSGVYAIRHRGLIFSTILYVGESHTGNLRKTITRHFQAWRRGPKRWFVGSYVPAQTDPGHTYERASVEVAVQVASAAKAIELQDAWIARLKPRDNRAGVLEEAPF